MWRHLFTCVVVLVLLAVAVPAFAVIKDWNDGTGNWSVPANWTPAGVPGAGDIVNIVFADDVARTVTYNYTGPVVTLGSMNVDMTGAGTNASTLSIGANPLQTGTQSIGVNGRGAVVQSGGTNDTGAFELRLGSNPGSLGTYTLSGTGQLGGSALYVGYGGTGTFNQSGGTVIPTGIGVAAFSNSVGSYVMDGGVLSPGSVLYVGGGGAGVFDQTGATSAVTTNFLLLGTAAGGSGTYNQSAGTVTVTGHLSIGEGNNGVGTYNLSGGTLNGYTIVGAQGTGNFSQTGGSATLSTLEVGFGNEFGSYTLSSGNLASASQIVGQFGGGSFTQNGGINTATSLVIGYHPVALGSYSLSAGTLNVTNESVAQSAIGNGAQSGGSFLQTGGTHYVNRLTVGQFGGSKGSYALNGGTLATSGDVYVGEDGNGTFSLAGGAHSVIGNLNVASNPGSTGSYTAIATLSAGNIYVGGRAAGAGGSGTFSVSSSGGNVTVPGTIKVYNAVGTGLSLSGNGSITTGGINLGGVPSLFNWSSGTLTITNDVVWDAGAGPTATGSIFGSALSLGLNKSLKVNGNESIGGNGVFNLNVGSGTHAVTGSITLKPGGTLTASSQSQLMYGSLTQAGGAISGTFRNTGNFIYQSGPFTAQMINSGTVSFGSNFSISSSLQNEGSITVGGGQTLTVTSTFTNLGHLTVNGGTIGSSSSLTNALGGTLTAHGTINPNLTNNGTMICDGVLMLNSLTNNGILQGTGTLSYGNNIIQNNAGGVINATSNGGALALQFSLANNAGATVNIGPTSTFSVAQNWMNSGIVNLQGAGARLSGGTVTNNGTIEGFGTITASMATSNSGVFRASGGELTFTATAITNSSSSQVQVLAGSTARYLQGMSNNAGTISLMGGIFDNNNKTLSNQGTINGHGTLRTGGLTNQSGRLISVGGGDMDVLGSVVNNGIVSIQSGRSAYFFGPVSGSGSFTGTGTAVFLNSLSPGNSPALVNFAGGATLGGGTSLVMELGGSTAGTGYDKIDVEGQLSIGGALSVSLFNGFTPAAWSSFDLLDWGSLAGTFSSISLPTLAVGQWDTSQLYVDGTLSVALAGDFDHSGAVNEADYVVWRKGLGTVFSPADFDVWRAHYGEGGSGSGSSVSAATVPEPGAAMLWLMAIVVVMLWRGGRSGLSC